MEQQNKETSNDDLYGYLFLIFLGVVFGLGGHLWWRSCEQSKENFEEVQCVVIDIGGHDTGGFMKGDSWSIKVGIIEDGSDLRSSPTLFGTTYQPVSIGQVVYTTRWTDEGATYYNTTFSTRRKWD